MRRFIGRSTKREERGAAMVEMALITPFLLLLLFGIIEFGWLFGQFNEVRHAVRETARYAAVSNPDRDGGGVGDSDLLDVACGALNLPTGAEIDLSVTATDTNADGTAGSVGDHGTVTIVATVPSLTNVPIISAFLPSDLTNSAEFRVEQPILWTTPYQVTDITC